MGAPVVVRTPRDTAGSLRPRLWCRWCWCLRSSEQWRTLAGPFIGCPRPKSPARDHASGGSSYAQLKLFEVGVSSLHIAFGNPEAASWGTIFLRHAADRLSLTGPNRPLPLLQSGRAKRRRSVIFGCRRAVLPASGRRIWAAPQDSHVATTMLPCPAATI